MSEISETEIKKLTKAQNYFRGYFDGKSDILEQIRTEIKSLQNANPSYWHSGDMVDREEVLEIIDKYTEGVRDQE